MSGDAYYDHQSEARGLRREEDVTAILRQVAPVYDRLLAPWLPYRRDAAIYEAACGPGIMLRWLKAKGYTQVSGSDISTAYVDLARATGFDVALASSLDDLRARPPESLEAVIGIDFIEHLPKAALGEFLRESCRVLRGGGMLILRAPNGDSPVVGRNLFNDVTHVWAYTSTALTALARIAGFAAVEFQDDTVASIQNQRGLRVPLMIAAQAVLRLLLRLATRENIECLGASYFACARK